MLIIQQTINHFQEALLPFVILQWYKKWHSNIMTKMETKKRAKKAVYAVDLSSKSIDERECNKETTETEELHIDDVEVQKAISESEMEPYEVTQMTFKILY